jgi:quercetin dioxygenase-like cupin family protein
MESLSLNELGRAHLDKAREAHAGRSAETVFGGRHHTLRQTVIGMVAGTTLSDHENPGEATLYVMSGQVRLGTGEDAIDGGAGDLLVIPESRHHLEALDDSVVVLTVAKHQ